MIEFGIIVTNRPETENSPRRRIIEEWYVTHTVANDGETKIHMLNGRVTHENGVKIGWTRYSNTSPIASVEARTITTASGSEYILGAPHSTKIHNDYDENAPVPERFLNAWLEGDNWLTI